LCPPVPPVDPRAHRGGPEVAAMRVAIVGTGFMGSVHADAWRQTPARIVAFVARNGNGDARALAAKHQVRVVIRLEDVLSDVDVVDICAPTDLHADFTLRAAAAGRHVICEKPLALTVEEGQGMIRACRRNGVRLFVGHVLRFFPEYRAARDVVARGEIGRPAVLRLSRCAFQPRKADNWFIDPARSGGMMLDLMVHDFDFARWVAGDVVRVFARSTLGAGRGEGPDHALAILTHRSGTISHVEGSWAFPPPTFRTRFEIAGTDGLIVFDSPSAASIVTYLHRHNEGAREEVALPRSPLLESPYALQLRAFMQALTGGDDPPVTAVDALAAVQIATAAIESSRRGTAIELTPPAEGP
ncbi:MAG: Gfo/Idh/MocA family protein, partial [bacterium]